MESANLHHHHHQHQLQDQLASSTSSLAAAPSCFEFGNNNHFWTSTNNNTFTGNSNNPNGRQKSDNLVSAPQNSSMVVQDLGFDWTNTNSNATGADNHQSFSSSSSQSAHDDDHHHLQLPKTEEEQSFPKFTEMLLNSPSNMDHDYYFLPQIKNEHRVFNEVSEKLLLKTLSSSCQMFNGHQISTGDFLSNTNINNNHGGGVLGVHGRGQFSQIYPSINISNLNQSSSSTNAMSSSSSLVMSSRALDNLASATFSGSLNHHNLNDSLGGLNSSFGLDQIQQPHNRLSCASHRSKVISSFSNLAIEAKRPGSSMEAIKGTTTQAAQKKSRLEPRTPCPPFKIRKEKLGDRIASLQQLVAPFGKTDTASVLMEAIGYIKFLQHQVETLSVPYMKSAARNKSYKTMQGGPKENANEEAKRDLRSRGLCLVPLSCMSYVTGDGGGGSVWPPSNFGGET